MGALKSIPEVKCLAVPHEGLQQGQPQLYSLWHMLHIIRTEPHSHMCVAASDDG